jgi:hypothetical protein
LEPDTLEASIRKGLGRAIVSLQGRDTEPYRDAILKAVTHDLRYDRQFERLRSRYALDLMRASGEESTYRDAVLAALANPAEGQSEDLMVEIACLLAEEGDAEARRAVYAAFERHQADDSFVGVEEIIRLDGVPGLVRTVPVLMSVDWKENAWVLSMIIQDVLEARLGKEEAWRALEQAANGDERVAAALEHVRAHRQEREVSQTNTGARQRRPATTYEDLETLLNGDASKRRYGCRHWGRNASDENLQRAAHALANESNPARRLGLVWVFVARPFPLDPSPLIALADSDDWDTSHAALLALEKVRHPDVRAYALRAIRDPRRASSAVDMLTLNFEEGDHALITWLAEQPETDEDEEHGRGLGMRRFVREHESPATARILTLTYDKAACSACREWLVEDLMQRDALPDAIRDECRWDANLELRAMAESGNPEED